VFALPASLAAHAGSWSPWMVAAVGVASMLIALSFAEVASRFDGTGGPYLYTRAAFGRFAAFEVGWMMWFTRAASWASVINVLVASLGFYWPAVTSGANRSVFLTVIIAIIAAINIRGIRQSSFVVNLLTVAKLLPLAVFIIVGLWHVDWTLVGAPAAVDVTHLSTTALLLIFAFGGYETVPVLGGEARDPRRAIPFALITTIASVTVIMALAQLVAVGTLPGLAGSKTPLADASALFLGAAGAAMITFGAVFSTSGNNMGQALSGSRNLFALAEQGDLPPFFGKVHPAYRTPVNAILVTAGVSLLLAVTGSFVTMAAASAISRLLVYVMTCAATIRLRAARFSGEVPVESHGVPVRSALFMVPGGPAVPAVAILIALAILVGATRQQLISGSGALVAGAVLYVIAVRARRTLRTTAAGIVATLLLTGASAAAQQSVFVVRHGERVDGGAGATGNMMAAADPELSEAGKARAQSLAAALKDAAITAIYVTEYKRTRQTAEPLAKVLGIEVTVVSSKEPGALIEKVKAGSGNALVIGHSNTVPEIIRQLGIVEPVKLADSDYDWLFVVTRSDKPSLLRLHYR
jgi:basic amino acid/polyamine antiporter, APA family